MIREHLLGRFAVCPKPLHKMLRENADSHLGKFLVNSVGMCRIAQNSLLMWVSKEYEDSFFCR